ncbi:MAG: glycosyltransferase family 2 protein [Natronomonas sp.]|nr:glycosyltransferase family 2 protein [Natronomonas sp.]
MTTSKSKVTGRTSLSRSEPDVSVVVPVYNEVENVPVLFDEIEAAFSHELGDRAHEILFVEDSSDDGTAELVDDLALWHEHVRALHLSRNWGQSAALAAGFDAANGDVIVPMDGDLQNDPADIPALLARVDDGADCVSGNRADRHDPWHKTIPSAIQTRLAKLTGADIDDFGCTLKAYRADALADVDLYGEEHRYLPAQLYDRGYEIEQIDVNHRPREHGESRYGVGRLVRGFSDLVFHVLWNRYSTRPFHLFGGVGLSILAVGCLVGLWVVGAFYLGDATLLGNLAKLLLSVGMVLFGALLTLFGVVVQFLTRIHYDDRPGYRVERVVE